MSRFSHRALILLINSVEVAWLLPSPTQAQRETSNFSHLWTKIWSQNCFLCFVSRAILSLYFFTELKSSSTLTFLKVCQSLRALWRLHHQPQQIGGPGTWGQRMETDVATVCQVLWGLKQSVQEAAPWNWRRSWCWRFWSSIGIKNIFISHVHTKDIYHVEAKKD